MSAPWRTTGLLLLAGCGGTAGQADPQPCAPVEAGAAAPADAGGLAGEYRLELVATSGDKRGDSAEGPLQLMPQEAAHQRLELPGGIQDTAHRLPLYGSSTADWAAVGAVVPGDAASTDPTRPGVLVIEGPTQVLLRVGSEANRRGVMRFDGAYTVLRVQQATDSTFAGTWESGVRGNEAGGHFCASRAKG
jgi:hypothetical protein